MQLWRGKFEQRKLQPVHMNADIMQRLRDDDPESFCLHISNDSDSEHDYHPSGEWGGWGILLGRVPN